MNRDDGVERIIVAGEESLGFEAIDELLQRSDLALKISVDLLALMRQFEICRDVVLTAHQFGVGREGVFDALLLAHHLLGSFGIRPEIWVGSLLFDVD